MSAALLAPLLIACPTFLCDGFTVERRTGKAELADEDVVDFDRRVLFVSRDPTDPKYSEELTAAAFYAFDLEAKWSERNAWQSINSWRGFGTTVFSPLPHAGNIDQRGFADPRGRDSPRWDLATFAAKYFAGDEETKCRLLAQSRFLTERLVELGEHAHANHPRCPSFDRWAKLANVEHIEIDLASPTSQSVGSLFGHLFLRIEDDQNRVIAFLAETRGRLEDDPLYPLKGIVGGYHAALFERSFLDTYREYVIAESRQIRRWTINLSEHDKLRFMELIWTRLHTARYSYYFFAQNCATLLLDLFNGIVPEGEKMYAEGALGKGPSSALDAIALAKSSLGEPLVTYNPEPFDSYEREALRARRDRRPITARLAELEPKLAKELDVVENADDPRRRAVAYERIAPALETLDPLDAAKWLRASAEIEAHASAAESVLREKTLAEQKKEEAKKWLEQHRTRVPEDLRELLEYDGDDEESASRRFLGYRRAAALIPELLESDADFLRRFVLVRAEVAADSIRKKDRRLHADLFLPDRSRAVLEQDYMIGYEPLVERAASTRVSEALLAVQRAKQSAHAARELPKGDLGKATRIEHERARYRDAFPRTGIDQFFAGGAYESDGTFGVMIRGVAYEETFGEQRRHGFPATTSFTFLKSEALWTLAPHPKVHASDTRFIGYRSINASRRFGFELYADLATRSTILSPAAGGGALFPLLASDDFSDHLILSTGAAYDAIFPEQGRDVHAVVFPVAAEARLGLFGPLHAIKGSVYARPEYDVFGSKLATGFGASAQVRVQLAEHFALFANGRWERRDDDLLGCDLGLMID